jgi:hypothetical protein
LQPPYDCEDIPFVAVRQQALTLVAPVRAGILAGLAERLDAAESDVQDALVAVSSLHFARFVLIDGPNGPGSSLAFESNHDGDLGPHLDSLTKALAPFEDLLFGSWEGYERGNLAGFVDEHAVSASTFYLGHPGLTVPQIINDRDLRQRLEELLDEEVDQRDLEGESAASVRTRLLGRLRDGELVTGPIDRGLPVQPWSTIAFWTLVLLVVLPLAVVFVPLALLVEWNERRTEPPPVLTPEGDTRLDPINRREDAITQNGLTHHVALRPGLYRRTVFKIVLWFLETTRQLISYEGQLNGISSIHFARWVLLDDDSVLFFSNYDGSWEAYLGDFVDKAHFYLTAVWSNTKWFPRTNALVFEGASKETAFKQWTRTFQVENRIWYSAYKTLTVNQVLRNALIREGASGDMTEKEARDWLALL